MRLCRSDAGASALSTARSSAGPSTAGSSAPDERDISNVPKRARASYRRDGRTRPAFLRHKSLLRSGRLAGKHEGLSRVDQAWIADLLLVGLVDHRVAHALPVDTLADAPQAIAASHNRGLHLGHEDVGHLSVGLQGR